jgi:hypothetical protein
MPSNKAANALLDIRDNIMLARRFVEGYNYEAF